MKRLIGLVFVAFSSIGAQTVSSRPYFGLEMGPVFTREQPGRSSTGFGAGVIAGHEFRQTISGELRLRFDYFEPGTVFISPGGCLGQLPCELPRAASMSVGSLAADGLIGDPTSLPGPLGAIGLGVRHVDISPTGGGGFEPFTEFGGGLRIPIGRAVMSAEVRYQVTVGGTNGLRWTLPMTLGARF